MAYKVKYEKVLPRTALPLSKRNWTEIGQIVKMEIYSGISNQVQVDGTPYAPLKPETIARKYGRMGDVTKVRSVDSRGKERVGTMFRSGVSGQSHMVKRGFKASVAPTKRLIDTGNLMDNQKVTASEDRVELTIGPTRDEIGYYQQEQPGKGNVPTAFFGISENAANRILKYVDQQIDKWLSRKS